MQDNVKPSVVAQPKKPYTKPVLVNLGEARLLVRSGGVSPPSEPGGYTYKP